MMLASILITFVIGLVAGYKKVFKISEKIKIVPLLTLILLFMMGFEMGSDRRLFELLPQIGGWALLISVSAIAGSFLFVFCFERILKHRSVLLSNGGAVLPNGSALLPNGSALLPNGSALLPNGSALLPNGSALLPKRPVMIWMLSAVAFGILLGRLYSVQLPGFLFTLLLMVLEFFVGFEIGVEEGIFRKMRSRVWIIGIQSFLTIAGTLLFGGLASFIINKPGFGFLETMGAAAGMGWYSLSGVMIGELHSALLGSVSFAANVIREMLAILLIPVLSRRFPLATASVGGAATMDVLLGLLSKNNTKEVTLIAFGQGVILSLMVPVLIGVIFR